MFKRIKAILYAIIGKKVGDAELKHNAAILDGGYEQMLNLLVETKRKVADVATSKHRVLRKRDTAVEQVATLEQQALQFLESGDEERATQALTKKAYVTQQVEAFSTELTNIEEMQVNLEGTTRELESRIENFAAEKEVLKARLTAAQATASVGETMTGISKEALNVGAVVGRLNERADELEAKGDALQELVASGTLEDVFNPNSTPLDRASAQLERSNAVAADLARLKKQLPAKAS
jgi:phage shock protein A